MTSILGVNVKGVKLVRNLKIHIIFHDELIMFMMNILNFKKEILNNEHMPITIAFTFTFTNQILYQVRFPLCFTFVTIFTAICSLFTNKLLKYDVL